MLIDAFQGVDLEIWTSNLMYSKQLTTTRLFITAAKGSHGRGGPDEELDEQEANEVGLNPSRPVGFKPLGADPTACCESILNCDGFEFEAPKVPRFLAVPPNDDPFPS